MVMVLKSLSKRNKRMGRIVCSTGGSPSTISGPFSFIIHVCQTFLSTVWCARGLVIFVPALTRLLCLAFARVVTKYVLHTISGSLVQGTKKWFAKHTVVRKDPGRAKHNSQGTAGRNFS